MRQPPKSTRTHTLSPFPTLFRSQRVRRQALNSPRHLDDEEARPRKRPGFAFGGLPPPLEQIRVGWNRRRRSTDPVNLLYPFEVDRIQIGRASCRERVCQYV